MQRWPSRGSLRGFSQRLRCLGMVLHGWAGAEAGVSGVRCRIAWRWAWPTRAAGLAGAGAEGLGRRWAEADGGAGARGCRIALAAGVGRRGCGVDVALRL